MNKVKIVMVKHENSIRKFIFEVPESLDIHKGNIVLTDTKFGPAFGIAVSEPFEVHTDDLTNFEGVTLPLRKIKEYASEEMQNYISEKANQKMKSQIRKVLNFDELPF